MKSNSVQFFGGTLGKIAIEKHNGIHIRAVRLTEKFGSSGTFLAQKNYAQKNR
jgi:hypothetical protein